MKRFRELALACGAIAVFISTNLKVLGTSKRLITLDDQFAFHQVSEPQISQDGAWIAYTVKNTDLKNDAVNNDIYMTSWDGSRTLKLTNSKDSESSPRFSPDGKYLAFVSSRQSDNGNNQIWLLNLAGGEAEKISNFPGGVSDFIWFPDGKRIAVIAEDLPGETQNGKKTPPPIVIDRFKFKEDGVGYLGKSREHLYVLDLATHKADILTPGEFNDKNFQSIPTRRQNCNTNTISRWRSRWFCAVT